MKSTLHILAVAAVLTLLSLGAHAEGPSGGGPREACRADAQTFCKGIEPGGGRIKDCLEDHYKEISDACYTALSKAPPPPRGQSNQDGRRGPSGGGAPDNGPGDQDDGDQPPPQ